MNVPALGVLKVVPCNRVQHRSGDHTKNAMLVSSRPRVNEETARVEDVAPTICHALGVEMPGGDGRTLLVDERS